MQIITRSQAAKIATINKETRCKFDGGKYKHNMLGKDVPEHMVKHVACVWSEKRKDSHGEYWALFCVSK